MRTYLRKKKEKSQEFLVEDCNAILEYMAREGTRRAKQFGKKKNPPKSWNSCSDFKTFHKDTAIKTACCWQVHAMQISVTKKRWRNRPTDVAVTDKSLEKWCSVTNMLERQDFPVKTTVTCMLFALHRSRRNTDHRAKCEFKTMNLPEGN
jgi:hypothetical protein